MIIVRINIIQCILKDVIKRNESIFLEFLNLRIICN